MQLICSVAAHKYAFQVQFELLPHGLRQRCVYEVAFKCVARRLGR